MISYRLKNKDLTTFVLFKKTTQILSLSHFTIFLQRKNIFNDTDNYRRLQTIIFFIKKNSKQ